MKKDNMAKRKQEELNAMQKRSKQDKQKQINAEKQRRQRKNVDIGRIQEWIVSNTEKMLKYKELKQLQLQEEQAFKEVEEQISEE